MSVSPSRFTLFKRSNGVYYIGHYLNGRRRWKSTHASTRPEALKVLTRFRELMQEPTRNISLRDFISQVLSYAEANYAVKTVRLFRSSMEGFSRLVKNAMLRELSPEHVDRYKSKRLREVSAVSVNVDLRMLKSAFNTAKRWRLLDIDPTPL